MAKVAGSLGLTEKSRAERNRPMASAPTIPAPSPIATGQSPWRKTIIATSAGLAKNSDGLPGIRACAYCNGSRFRRPLPQRHIYDRLGFFVDARTPDIAGNAQDFKRRFRRRRTAKSFADGILSSPDLLRRALG